MASGVATTVEPITVDLRGFQDSQHGTEGPLSCKGNFTVTLAGCGRITWC
jgi:hypothetical protein